MLTVKSSIQTGLRQRQKGSSLGTLQRPVCSCGWGWWAQRSTLSFDMTRLPERVACGGWGNSLSSGFEMDGALKQPLWFLLQIPCHYCVKRAKQRIREVQRNVKRGQIYRILLHLKEHVFGAGEANLRDSSEGACVWMPVRWEVLTEIFFCPGGYTPWWWSGGRSCCIF